MSTVMVVACDTCEVAGPLLRNHLGTSAVLQSYTGEAAAVWALFLNEHEYHQLTLYVETTPYGPSP